MNVSDRVFNSW